MWLLQFTLLLLLIPSGVFAAIEIVIVGTPTQRVRDLSTGNEADSHVRVLDEHTIEQSGISNVAELLEMEPGVNVRSMGGQGSFSLLTIRGSTARQVAVYLDGILINGARGQAVDLSQFSLAHIESIRIYPGRQPIELSGGNGAAGVIQLISRKSTQHRRIELKTGSFGYTAAAFNSGWNMPGGSAFFSLEAQHADNDFDIINDNGTDYNSYDDRVEPRHNNQTRRKSLTTILNKSRLFEDTEGILFISGSIQRQHVPNRLNDALNSAYIDKRKYILELKLDDTDEAANWKSEWSIQYQSNTDTYQDLLARVGLDARDNDYIGSKITLSQHLRGDWIGNSINFLIAATREKFASIQRLGSQSFLENREDYRQDSVQMAVETTVYISDNNLSLTPQLQWLGRSDSNYHNNSSLSDKSFNLRLSLSYANGHNIWSAFAGRYERYPGFSELYAYHGFSVGNPNLKKEEINNITLGLQTRRALYSGILNLSAQVFVRDSRDLIVASYDSRGIGHYDNISRALITGFDVKASLQTVSTGRWECSYALTESSTRSDISSYNNQRTPNTPEHELNIFYTDRIVFAPNWRYHIRFNLSEGSFYDRANLLPVASKHQFDTGLTYKDKFWKIEFLIKNLGNSVSEAFNGFAGPGRSFQLSLVRNF